MTPYDPDYNPDRDEEHPEQYDGLWVPDLPEDDPEYTEYLQALQSKKEEDNG